MAFLLPSFAAVSIYCAAYTIHCFQKKHWLAAAAAVFLSLLPLACGAVLLFVQ